MKQPKNYGRSSYIYSVQTNCTKDEMKMLVVKNEVDNNAYCVEIEW